MKRMSLRLAGVAGLLVVLATALASTPARAHDVDPGTLCRPRGPRVPRDPLIPMLHRIDRYFRTHEVDGVVVDARVVLNETEAIRLSVVSQLLGYEELYKVVPKRRFRHDIQDRADYLIDRLELVRSGGVFDGMLGYALLEAYDATGDPRHLAAGKSIVDELKGISHYQYVLNGGLMAAMAFAKYYQLTGDVESGNNAHEVLAGLPPYQHDDGSFPHWCVCSTDIHYTDWMATELILIRRMLDDPLIDPMLARMHTFLSGRIAADGVTSYQQACDNYPGCVVYYYSIATGCDIDYDTRAFTNELGYSALLFEHFKSPQYRDVMTFMHGLEHGGTWADKWDFWPPPEDPYYPWTAADTSVVNTSLLLWSLGSVLVERRDAGSVQREWEAEDDASDVAFDAVADAGDGGDTAPGTRRAQIESARLSDTAPETRGPWSAVDRLLLSGASPNYCYAAATTGGTGDASDPEHPRIASPASSRAGGAEPSASLRLESITPNPTPAGSTIRFSTPSAAAVSIVVYDAAGRRIRELFSGTVAAGAHETSWDRRDSAGRACRAGLYFVLLRAGADVRSARLLLSP